MAKYRIVQKGGEYNPQYRCGLFWCKIRDYADGIKWMPKTEACRIVRDWETRDKFNSSPETIYDPKDICGGS